MVTSIRGSERQALREALTTAFQSYPALRRMGLDQLDFDINLRADAAGGLLAAASELIEEMDEKEGRPGLVRLVESARAERPTNPALREFERKFMNTSDLFGDVHLTEDLQKKINTQGDFERVIVNAAGFPPFDEVMKGLGPAEYRVCLVGYRMPDGRKVYGTGFLVANNMVMTNHHVVGCALQSDLGGIDMEVTFGWRSKESSVTRYRLTQTDWLVVTDKVLDYAILRVDGQPGTDPIVKGGSLERGYFSLTSETPETGEPLIIAQHPYDKLDREPSTLRLTIGFVRPREEGQPQHVIRHTANTSEGSSGSPVFTGRADLIALHNWGGAEHNAAIRIGDIKDHFLSVGLSDLLR